MEEIISTRTYKKMTRKRPGPQTRPGYNDLATTNPELLSDWDYGKNDPLTPQDVTKGSQKKVWWKCTNGHSWFAQVNSRVAGRGCPYCCNRKVLRGYNDLATTRPDLLPDWDYEKNKELNPEEVIAGSKKVVWWKCHKCGYEWRTGIMQRHRGTGCPSCARVRVHKGKTDLLSLHPDLVKEWNFEKNPDSPADIACFSRKKVSWICPKGHEYMSVVSDRVKGNGCPICSRERRVSFPEKAILYYISKIVSDVEANYRQPWLKSYELDIYLPKYKTGIEYDGIYGHSKKAGISRDIRKNMVCSDNGVTLIRIREYGCPPLNSTSIDYILKPEDTVYDAVRTALESLSDLLGIRFPFASDMIDLERDSGSIYSLIEYSEKENSLEKKAPQVAGMWHPTKNGRLRPEFVSIASSKRVWWLGACGHEWISPVAYEAKSGLCPYCSGKRILQGFNDLATVNPAVSAEWDYEKNAPVTPQTVTAGSGKKVWWKCKKNHSWKASIVSRNRGNGCPICANRIALKGYNDVASAPGLFSDWNFEKNKENPETACIGSDKKVWWKCHECGHIWKASITDRYHGAACPACSKKARSIHVAQTYVSKSGSLLQNRPDLAAEWDFDKNSLLPEQVTCGSTKKVWWICKHCQNQWNASIVSRTRTAGSGCPECGTKKGAFNRQQTLLKKKAPLSVTHPDVAAAWNFEKNSSLTPDTVTSGSGRKVWWKCAYCGYEWESSVCDRCRRDSKCPKCRAIIRSAYQKTPALTSDNTSGTRSANTPGTAGTHG